MGLIGTHQWNPRGESMWGIVQKIAQRNHFSWVDVKRIVGAHGAASFESDERKVPDAVRNFELPGLAISAGWSLAVFQHSFSEGYEPPWLAKESSSSMAMSNTLRICPNCFAEGIHLCLHQFLNWTHCPIHRAALSDECLSCGSRLPRYEIKSGKNVIATCRDCQAILLDGRKRIPDRSVTQRLTVLSEYSSWMNTLQNALYDESSRFAPVANFHSDLHLAHAHALIPGPTWIGKCVANAEQVRVNSLIWSGKPITRPTKSRSFTLQAYNSTDRFMFSRHCLIPSIADDVRRLLVEQVRHRDRDLRRSFDYCRRYAAVFEFNSRHCALLYGDRSRAWDTGYWLWRRCNDAAYPDNKSWSRLREPLSFYRSWIWQSWVQQIGPFLWSPVRHFGIPYNLPFVRWLTKRWLHQSLIEAYVQFVGIACRNVGNGWLNTSGLESALVEVGDTSRWWIEEQVGVTRLHQLSTIAPLDAFKNLHHVGFIGNDLEYPKDFGRLRPLQRLLSPRPIQLAAWKSLWETVSERTSESSMLQTLAEQADSSE